MTAEELLKQMSVEPFAEEMVCCVIDPETRVIDVPAEYQLLGVESDEKVERMYFQCPKIVGDNIDLSKLALRVNFRNANDRNMVTLMIDTITTVGITPKTKIRNPRKKWRNP